MTEFLQSIEELQGEELADYRSQQIDKKDDYGRDYQRLRPKLKRWRRVRVGMAVAPFVAAGSLMFTETGREANNFQRFVGGLYSLMGSAGLAGAASARVGSLQNRSEQIALQAAQITNELGIDRDAWINEGVGKWRQKQERQRELRERNYI